MADTTKTTSKRIAPDQVIPTLDEHMLVDGFHIIIDLDKSQGSRLVDARDGKSYLDFFQFFASAPLGFNHPRLVEPDFLGTLQKVSINKPSNSDFYTTYMAEFVDTLGRLAMPADLPNLFMVSGGSLAVENALKAAFDWKVRKNFAKGETSEVGTKVIHFREAFHGRSGYTLSLTNTDPAKTDYFPKFDWPRVTNPKITFPLESHQSAVEALEKKAMEEIKDAIAQHGDEIAALIIEPIQGEGGDNHFRPEFIQFLRRITEENEIIFIFDEIQSGVGITGKMWAYEHTGVTPDIISFGKKMQVCGIMASERINEVDSVFKVPSRINSTWGGNLIDMVRATRYLQVIEEENLVENARVVGEYMLAALHTLHDKYPDIISNVRGKGLMIAFDLPDGEFRGKFFDECHNRGGLVFGCGPRSVRFRPALNFTNALVDEGVDLMDKALATVIG